MKLALLSKSKPLIDFLLSNLNLIIFSLIIIPILTIARNRRKLEKKSKAKLQKAIATQMNEPFTLHPEIDPALCAGCGACTRACPEGDIIGLINQKAVLVTPTKCVGHGECEAVCPLNAIKLVFGTKTRGMDIPRLTKNYETNVPGLYIAGELGGMGLIRNAIKQGVQAATHALENPGPSVAGVHDLFIVGAGPAGLAASLVAIEKKKSYVLIEQNSFGGTVANFPRQKLVMSHPFNLPIFGTITFDSHQVIKEDLLALWEKIRKKANLKIHEKTRFENIQSEAGHFTIKTNNGVFKAKKVILAMGVRGSPRRLQLPNEDLPKVTYNLIDSSQYKQKCIVVVGGGNAGVEAAQMLGAAPLKNTVHLLVRSHSFDRCNQENIDRITAMEKKGLVSIWYKSSVKEIETDHLVIEKEGEQLFLKNDYLFIFAGAEMPHKFLMSLGVAIDKKFGVA